MCIDLNFGRRLGRWAVHNEVGYCDRIKGNEVQGTYSKRAETLYISI
jgi:hypothetical protein